MKLVASFASGSNHAGELVGFAEAGWDVGFAADKVNQLSEDALLALAGSGVAVFADSGAFGEMTVTDKGLVVKKVITDAAWRSRIALYLRLGRVLGDQLYAVAPDRVGDQVVTVQRLRRYAAEMKAVADTGAVVLVPLQKGALSLADMHRLAASILPWAWTPAIPSRLASTSLADVEAYIREIQPAAIHMLGMGETSKKWPAFKAMFDRAARHDIRVSLDSVKITAHVGRKRSIARLTAAQDRALDSMRSEVFGERAGLDATDWTDAASEPDEWLTASAKAKLWNQLRADMPRAGLPHKAPTDLGAWLQEDDRYLDPIIEMAINEAWAEHAHKASTAERKRRAIVDVFSPVGADAVYADMVADAYRRAADAGVSRAVAARYVKRYETKLRSAAARRLGRT